MPSCIVEHRNLGQAPRFSGPRIVETESPLEFSAIGRFNLVLVQGKSVGVADGVDCATSVVESVRERREHGFVDGRISSKCQW